MLLGSRLKLERFCNVPSGGPLFSAVLIFGHRYDPSEPTLYQCPEAAPAHLLGT